jgi:hypothetical protein
MVRIAPLLSLIAVVVCSLVSVTPAAAQELHRTPVPVLRDASLLEQRTPAPATLQAPQNRPSALIPLYLSFGTLQALDVHSTTTALSRGAVEANPLMGGVAGSPLGLAVVKAGGTAGVIYASERLWKKNKGAAVVFMIGANSAMAWVVQHNYRTAR